MYTAHLLSGETQRPVPGWAGYVVTSLGRVFSFKCRGRYAPLKMDTAPHLLSVFDSHGYPSVRLRAGRCKGRVAKISRLIALAFHGVTSPKVMARHWDGNKQNNRLPNIRAGSAKDNAADAQRHGTVGPGHVTGRGVGRRAVSIAADARTRREIAAAHGVSVDVVDSIKCGRAYAGVRVVPTARDASYRGPQHHRRTNGYTTMPARDGRQVRYCIVRCVRRRRYTLGSTTDRRSIQRASLVCDERMQAGCSDILELRRAIRTAINNPTKGA